MDVFDLAMKAGADREARYRALASASPVRGVAGLCTVLRAAEAVHLRRLAALREATEGSPPVRVPSRVAGAVIRRLALPAGFLAEGTERDLLRQARAMVRDVRSTYRDRLVAAVPRAARDACLKLAQVEERHAETIEDLLAFVGRPGPGHWLEQADWSHLDAC